MQKSFLRNILTPFASLSIMGLRLYLSVDCIYQSASKETFLSKLEEIFNSHLNAGDTELLIYKGKCASQSCSNCGQIGYRFVGNNSKNYFDLIIETEVDYIKDIFSCDQFQPETEIEGLQTKSSIYINLDEEVTFKGNTEYWIRVYAATSAYSEIITTPPRLMNFKDLCYWLDKHADTNRRIGDYKLTKPIMKWSSFSLLYSELNEIRSFISDHLDQITQANLSKESIKSEEEMIDWFVKYENIFGKMPLDIKCFSLFEGGKNFSFNNLVIFSGDEFSQTLDFADFFHHHHQGLLEKYSTYTGEEEDEVSHNPELHFSDNHSSSLKFHIQKRKALEEIGINIPFYIAIH